ncbi:MAG: hypothetical protein K2X47_02620, partial [Bdellovibrionales bacterium]|nr:hypothetical protein [Bdellovibrionales bacterium]
MSLILCVTRVYAFDLQKEARRLGIPVPDCSEVFRFHSDEDDSPDFIECLGFDGKFDSRFEDLNLDGKIDRYSKRDIQGGYLTIHTDRNLDGVWDMISRTEITNAAHAISEFSIDHDFKQKFRTWREVRPTEVEAQCSLMELKKMRNIFSAPATFLEKNLPLLSRDSKINFKFGSSCSETPGFEKLGRLTLSALQKGVSCLEGLGTEFAKKNIQKVASLLSATQAIPIACDHIRDSDALAWALLPSSLGYPRITLSKKLYPLSDAVIESTLFHEIFHTLDDQHDHYLAQIPDYTTSCEVCCFKQGGYVTVDTKGT